MLGNSFWKILNLIAAIARLIDRIFSNDKSSTKKTTRSDQDKNNHTP